MLDERTHAQPRRRRRRDERSMQVVEAAVALFAVAGAVLLALR